MKRLRRVGVEVVVVLKATEISLMKEVNEIQLLFIGSAVDDDN